MYLFLIVICFTDVDLSHQRSTKGSAFNLQSPTTAHHTTRPVSPPEVFKNETTAFLKCAGSSALTSVAALDTAIERCVEVKHGIGGLYVYRGLFAAQLYHCFKVADRSHDGPTNYYSITTNTKTR